MPAVSLRGITKRFPGAVANDDVDFDAAEGEVHALLGENGAGKSTLSNILTGLYRPDEGEIRLYGEPVEFRSPRDALDAGICMVHQHFRLVPTFTVAENVLLGDHRDEGRRFFVRPRNIERRVAELGERHQVLVVTHLAQVAAFATEQIAIEKRESADRTVTTSRPVSGEERLAELSRMLSGQPASLTARRHAEELLQVAAGNSVGAAFTSGTLAERTPWRTV